MKDKRTQQEEQLEFDRKAAIELGLSGYNILVGMGLLYGGETVIKDRLLAAGTNPEFGKAYDRYVSELREYLAALEMYLNIAVKTEWKKEVNAKIRKEIENEMITETKSTREAV